MSKILFLVMAGLGLGALPAAGQKFEVERRIRSDQFPVPAREYLAARHPGVNKFKFYQEQSDQGLSFEAKFRKERSRYSIEFDAAGRHLETERQISRQDLPEETFQRITTALNQHFRRSRITRIQERLEEGTVDGYEIEVKGKSESHLGFFEVQVDSEGRLREVRTIVDPPNQFLFY